MLFSAASLACLIAIYLYLLVKLYFVLKYTAKAIDNNTHQQLDLPLAACFPTHIRLPGALTRANASLLLNLFSLVPVRRLAGAGRCPQGAASVLGTAEARVLAIPP